MKKKSIILILFIALFVIFIGKVKAEDVTGDYVVLLDNLSMFEGASCSGGGSDYYIGPSGGDLIARYTGEFGKKSTAEITCTWTHYNGGVSKYLNTNTIKYTVTNYSEQSLDITRSITPYSPYSLFDYGTVKSVDINYSGSSMRYDCEPGDHICRFEVIRSEEISDTEKATGTIVYVKNNSLITVNLTIRVVKAFRVYANTGSGNCGMPGSGWTQSRVHQYLFEHDMNSAYTLPLCSPNNPMLDFSGWVPVNTLNDGDSALTPDIGSCKEMDGFIKNSKTYNTGDISDYGNLYMACYDYKPRIYLYTNRNDLKDQGSWIKESGIYYIDGQTAVLPDVESGEGYEFIGWRQVGTNESRAVGETVSMNTGEKLMEFTAVFQSLAEADTFSYNVAMNLGETRTLAELLDDSDLSFDTCTLNEGLNVISTNMNSGECLITSMDTGKASLTATSKNSASKESTYIVSVTVVSSGAPRKSGALVSYDDGITDPDGFGDESFSILSIGTDLVCRYFYVDLDEHFGSVASFNGQNENINVYKADPQCSIKKDYLSICLDPGQLGPAENFLNFNGHAYQYSRKLDISGNKLDAGLYTILTEVKRDSGNTKWNLAAADFAARILSFVNHDENNNNIAYPDHHAFYKSIASKVGKNTELTSVSGLSNNSFVQKASDYYKKAVTVSYSEEDVSNMELTFKDNNDSGNWSGNQLVMINEGNMIFPTGTTESSIRVKPNCLLPGYSCTILENPESGSGLVRHYKFQIVVDPNVAEVPDDTNMDKLAFLIEYNNAGSLGGGFVITHKTLSNVYQRMILLNPGETSYLMFVRWAGECNTGHPKLDYTKCTDEDSCEQLNIGLFNKLKCCNLISDKTSYAYQYLCNGGSCTYSSFLQQCKYDGTYNRAAGTVISDTEKIDLLQILEARVGNTNSPKYKCVVAVSKNCTTGGEPCSDSTLRKVTDRKKDISGNKYSLEYFSQTQNPYCRISCKEDWAFTLGAFKNYTREFSIPAGGYFKLTDDLYIGGSRECVTTKIDYEAYMKHQQELSEKMVEAWNLYEEWRGWYSDLVAMGPKCEEPVKDYYKTIGDSVCETCTTGDDGEEVCEYDHPGEDYYKDGRCQEYTITVKRSRCNGTLHYRLNGTSYYAACGGQPSNASHNLEDAGSIHGTGKCYLEASGGAGGVAAYVEDRENEKFEFLDGGFGPSPGGSPHSASLGHSSSGQPKRPQKCIDIYNSLLGSIAGNIEAYRKYVQDLEQAIRKNAETFSICQNFQQITKSKLFPEVFEDTSKTEYMYSDGTVFTNKEYVRDGSNIIDLTDQRAYQIDTQYSPYGGYDYEEKDYMDMVKPNNYIIPYDDVNDKKMGTKYVLVENDCASPEIVTDENGRKIKLCRHFYTTEGFKGTANRTETENSIYGHEPTNEALSKKLKVLGQDPANVKSFGDKVIGDNVYGSVPMLSLCAVKGGSTYSTDPGTVGECARAQFFYYDVNYIKHRLSNSSYWRNNGEWYVNEQDEKAFATTANSLSGNKDYWKSIAGFNVFPISMHTRRNLYQYVYRFANIGQYSDNALGRIMGGEVEINGKAKANGHINHVIEDNERVCFYEVYESVCRCCGEPIVTESITINNDVSTTAYINTYNVNYNESDYNKLPYDSTLGLYTNVVSLSNLASSTKRVLGANWQANTPFILDGKRYTTNQGMELISQIESVADEVYNEVPEYSFTLNPAAISDIRTYNKDHEYGIPSTIDMTIYGNVGFRKSDSGKWEVTNAEVDKRVRFSHYASEYIEALDKKGYTTQQYAGKLLLNYTGANVVCTVDAGKVNEIYSTDKFVGCRWIDYITQDENGNPIRLAFK